MSKAESSLALLLQTIDQRLEQHQANLDLWHSGYLTPTEPDQLERERIVDRLKAAIYELKKVRESIA